VKSASYSMSLLRFDPLQCSRSVLFFI